MRFKIISATAKPLPPTIDTEFRIKSTIEKIMTIVLPHLLPLNRAPEMINENIPRITSITAMNPPIADAIIPNMECPIMPEIAPIAIAAVIHTIPDINCKTARIVIPIGLVIIDGADCSVDVDFPHFGQKMLASASSAPQCLQNANDCRCLPYR